MRRAQQAEELKSQAPEQEGAEEGAQGEEQMTQLHLKNTSIRGAFRHMIIQMASGQLCRSVPL